MNPELLVVRRLRLLIGMALRLKRNRRVWLCWSEEGWRLL